MKAFKIIIALTILFFTGSLRAQVSVNINVGSPPPWGPAGYTETRYYYLPDVESYYDVQTTNFIYYDGGGWVHRSHLPNHYHNYDLYNGYKVVMTDYHGNSPYIHFKDHKVKYKKGYHGKYQKTVGNKPGKVNSNNGSKQNHKQSGGKNNNKGNSNGNKKTNNSGKGNGGHGGGKGKK